MRRSVIWNDFTQPSLQQVGGDNLIDIVVSGAGSGLSAQTTGANGAEKVHGAAVLRTNGAANSFARLNLGVFPIVPAAGLGPLVFAVRAFTPVLSTVAEEFIVRLGLIQNHAHAAEPGSGFYFEYNRLAGGDFWRLVTSNAGARTKITSTLAVPVAGYTWYAFVLGVAGTRVDFYHSLDGLTWALLDSLTTNIPSPNTGVPQAVIDKSAGITDRQLRLDTMLAVCEFVRSR